MSKADKVAQFDAILELRFREKLTWDEIAEKRGIARSTILRWRRSEEFQLTEAKWRRLMREETRTETALIGNRMVAILNELAESARSEFVRMTSASKLIDVLGIADEAAESLAEDAGELVRFMKQLRGRQIGPVGEVLEAEVRPGGLLPKPIADLVEAGREAVLSEEPEEEE